MLLKGDKIKQIKEINGFNKVGQVFEVSDIDMGVISFISSFGKGIMSYDEFERYFEKVVEEVWSEWTPILGELSYCYRTKGTLTEFSSDGIHTFSKTLPEDTYNFETGIEICKKKWKIKKLQRELKGY